MGKSSGRPKLRKKMRRRLLVERLSERRVLAAITGAVFDDANHSLQQDAGEVNVPQRVVYIDANDNAALDPGETYAVSESDGTFEFPGLADGTYLLRLFNGTSSQTQTTPVEATIEGGTVDVLGGLQLEFANGVALALTDTSVVVGNVESGAGLEIPVGDQLSKLQTLPDGKVLVIGTDDAGGSSFVVDPATFTATPANLADPSVAWSDVAIDATGRGVLLPQAANGDIPIFAINAASSSNIQVTATGETVPADTQVVTSHTGPRSVFASEGAGGLQYSLWSNSSPSFITAPLEVSGTTDLLAFDDASGLLAFRTASGGVSVYDVDGLFPEVPLHTVNDVTGPVAIDGARDLLMTVSPVDASLRLFDLRSGDLIADYAVDLSTVGQVSSIALTNSNDSLVVLGAAGVTEVALRKATAHEITINAGQDPDPVLFGVSLNGDNTAPTYSTVPTFATEEDESLALPAPAALNSAIDLDGDDFVLLQLGQPANGTATLQINGQVEYEPNLDFNGTDTIQVLLHDGRDATEVTLNINVAAVPDAPTGITLDLDPLPENAVPGMPFGTIEVIDADGPNHTIAADDPRIGVRGGDLIFLGGPINFEDEPVIQVGITVTDSETQEVLEEIVAVSLQDENDPITGITPHEADVPERAKGEHVAFIEVEDQDTNQNHTITVDDDRFMIDGVNELRLKNDEELDFETEPTVVVNVTATDEGGGDSFTQSLTIKVGDIAEQPVGINLSNETVMELVPGAVVGAVSLEGQALTDQFEVTVDDDRFEVDGATLKLLDDRFVERANQAEIELTLTVVDTQFQFEDATETFVIIVEENFAPFHNQENPYDVDHNDNVTALDALAIINFLNAFGPGPVGQGDPGLCYDVNADGFVTALDALLVLNFINRVTLTGTVGDGENESDGVNRGEGEQVPANDVSTGLDSDDDDEEPSEDGGNVTVTPSRGSSTTGGGQDASVNRDTLDAPSRNTDEEFARNVDETLRLLSDE